MVWLGMGASEGTLRLARPQSENAPVFVTSRTLEDLKSIRLKEVLTTWQVECRGSEQLPAAKGFDILDYRVAVGSIDLVTVQRHPLDFIYRVHSSAGAKYVGCDLTGRSVNDHPDPQYGGFLRSVFTRATSARKPQIVIEDLLLTDNQLMPWEGLVMPMQDDEGQVSRLIFASEFLR